VLTLFTNTFRVIPLIYIDFMGSKEHVGDFTCIENGAFRTFYMTCKCGWSSPVKFLAGAFSSYCLHNMWLSHVGKGGRVE
jgi:hypothetical protein